jgi:hypothetical protein
MPLPDKDAEEHPDLEIARHGDPVTPAGVVSP